MPKLGEQRGVLIHAFSGLIETQRLRVYLRAHLSKQSYNVLKEISLVKVGHIAGNQ